MGVDSVGGKSSMCEEYWVRAGGRVVLEDKGSMI